MHTGTNDLKTRSSVMR